MLQTGRLDSKGIMIEEMDVVQVGFEVGVIVFNEHAHEFFFANDFMVKPLNEIEHVTVLMKHTKLDALIDNLHFNFGL